MDNIYRRLDSIAHLPVLNDFDYTDDDIISCLRYLGPVFNVIASFISKRRGVITNVTDCINTSDYLMDLFSPSKMESIKDMIPRSDYNILYVTISHGYPYHHFILIKICDQWYLLNSYDSVYSLMIMPVSITILEDLLLGSDTIHEQLFMVPCIPTEKCKLDIECCRYDSIPIDSLRRWIDEYRCYLSQIN